MEFKSKNIRMLCFFWTHATCQKIYLLDLFDQKMTFTNSDPVCFIVAFAKSIILCYQRPASLFSTKWDQILYGFDFEFMKIPYLFDTMIMIVLRNISWNCSNKHSNSNRFWTRCDTFWFFVLAWFTCCHLDFCKLCVSVPCKALYN